MPHLFYFSMGQWPRAIDEPFWFQSPKKRPWNKDPTALRGWEETFDP